MVEEKFGGSDEILGAKKVVGQIDGAEFKFLGLETRFERNREIDCRNQISKSNCQNPGIPSSKIWFVGQKDHSDTQNLFQISKFDSQIQISNLDSPKFDPQTLIPLTTKTHNSWFMKIF